ncbi:hypothetical protein ACJ4V0_15725 [Phreatobacter sp. HK31-P]
MARFRLISYFAEKMPGGSIQIEITSASKPIPTETVEARTTAEALQALAVFAEKAKAAGHGAQVHISLDRNERAPNGFKAAKTHMEVNL